MSFGVIQYKSPFRCVPRNPNHICGFCGTNVDVKYAYDVDSSENYPEASKADATSVYSCSSCTLKKMYHVPSKPFQYEFDISDPYRYMSTLQKMYKDCESAKNRFHERWFFCCGCNVYVSKDCLTNEETPEGNQTLRCTICGKIHSQINKEGVEE